MIYKKCKSQFPPDLCHYHSLNGVKLRSGCDGGGGGGGGGGLILVNIEGKGERGDSNS